MPYADLQESLFLEIEPCFGRNILLQDSFEGVGRVERDCWYEDDGWKCGLDSHIYPCCTDERC